MKDSLPAPSWDSAANRNCPCANSRDSNIEIPGAVGDRALKTLSELTGATAYKPGPPGHARQEPAELQQAIRGR